MRILFSSLQTHGHTYPLVPLAIAARKLGHDVTFVTGEAFADALTPHGIEHVTGGLGMREAFAIAQEGVPVGQAQDVRPDVIPRVFGSVLPRRFASDLKPVIADRKPDLIVHELANAGAGLAAKVAGLPALCHSFGRMWQPDDIGSLAQSHLAEVAADLGVSVPSDDLMVLGTRTSTSARRRCRTRPSWPDRRSGSSCGRCRSPSRATCRHGCSNTASRWCT